MFAVISLLGAGVFYGIAALTPRVAQADASLAYGATNTGYTNACLSLPRNLSYGTSGDDVAELQAYLAGHRYPGSSASMITGYFGDVTRTVVASLQYEHDLPTTGTIDTKTRTFLATNCSTPVYAAPPRYVEPRAHT